MARRDVEEWQAGVCSSGLRFECEVDIILKAISFIFYERVTVDRGILV